MAVLTQGLITSELVVWWINTLSNVPMSHPAPQPTLREQDDGLKLTALTGNALFSLAAALGPATAGLLANVWIGLPFTLGGLLCLLSGTLYLYWYKKVRQA